MALIPVALPLGGCVASVLCIVAVYALVGTHWRFAHGGPCLMEDVNADGVGEIAVTVYENDFAVRRAALLDGATGEEIWVTEPYLGAETVGFCASGRYFGVAPAGRRDVHLIPAKEGPPGRRTMPASPAPFPVGHPAAFDLTDAPARLRAPERGYTLTESSPGTPLLALAADDAWQVDLPMTSDGGLAVFLGVPGGLVVIGKPHPYPVDRPSLPQSQRFERTTVMGVAATDGSTRFRVVIGDPYNVAPTGAVFNDRFVVAGIGNQIVALDPSTGETAWRLGP